MKRVNAAPEVGAARDQGILGVRPPTLPPKRARRRERLRWLATGARPDPPASRLGTVEAPESGKLGICCSGGGIRSAAFNLGALQALQQRRSLREASYLAAVSGGSYIASAFLMVAQRPPDGAADAVVTAKAPPFHPQSPEEQYLRNHCSYLAPDGLSKVFLGFRVLLGLLFNVFFLGLALFAAGVLLAVLYAQTYGGFDACLTASRDTCSFTADVPDGVWWVLGALVAGMLVDGLFLLLLRPKRDFWRAGFETWAIRFMLAAVAVAVIALLVPIVSEVVLDDGQPSGTQERASGPALPAVGVGSFVTVLVAALLQLRARASEPATVLKAAKGARAAFGKLGRRLRIAFAYLAGAIAGPLLLLAILIGASAWGLDELGDGRSEGHMLVIALVTAGVFGFLYLFADLNAWSLHPFYRYRLCRAFALERVLDDDGKPVARPRENRKLVKLSESAVAPVPGDAASRWPTLLVCAAANVSDPGATPPGRSVTSFTFSATAIGGPLVGALGTTEYEDALGLNRQRDITLPAAVAMSGAALSPSMGKETRRPLTFLMALANARLGVWVPNPSHVGRRNWSQPGKRDVIKMPRPWYLLCELFGCNRLDARFLYVTDGGHYENLGLVELLRRGCTAIHCFDASGGDDFTALGDAIALARSELGVEIAIDPRPLVAEGERHLAERDCVSGEIRYPDGTPGVLVYARSVMTEHVPFDVTAYHEGDPVFPHHSTADQLYTDQKFEAYRALGWCAGQHADDERRRQSPGAGRSGTAVRDGVNGLDGHATTAPVAGHRPHASDERRRWTGRLRK